MTKEELRKYLLKDYNRYSITRDLSGAVLCALEEWQDNNPASLKIRAMIEKAENFEDFVDQICATEDDDIKFTRAYAALSKKRVGHVDRACAMLDNSIHRCGTPGRIAIGYPNGTVIRFVCDYETFPRYAVIDDIRSFNIKMMDEKIAELEGKFVIYDFDQFTIHIESKYDLQLEGAYDVYRYKELFVFVRTA